MASYTRKNRRQSVGGKPKSQKQVKLAVSQDNQFRRRRSLPDLRRRKSLVDLQPVPTHPSQFRKRTGFIEKQEQHYARRRRVATNIQHLNQTAQLRRRLSVRDAMYQRAAIRRRKTFNKQQIGSVTTVNGIEHFNKSQPKPIAIRRSYDPPLNRIEQLKSYTGLQQGKDIKTGIQHFVDRDESGPSRGNSLHWGSIYHGAKNLAKYKYDQWRGDSSSSTKYNKFSNGKGGYGLGPNGYRERRPMAMLGAPTKVKDEHGNRVNIGEAMSELQHDDVRAHPENMEHIAYFQQTDDSCRGKILLGGVVAANQTFAQGQILYTVQISAQTFQNTRAGEKFDTFNQWRPRRLKFHFAPNQGSSAIGQFIHFVDPDPGVTYGGGAVGNINAFMSHPNKIFQAAENSVVEYNYHGPMLWVSPLTQYTSSFAQAALGSDARMIAAGTYVISFPIPFIPGATVVLGSIWLEYDIDFAEPTLDSDVLLMVRWAQSNGAWSSSNGAASLGTAASSNATQSYQINFTNGTFTGVSGTAVGNNTSSPPTYECYNKYPNNSTEGGNTLAVTPGTYIVMFNAVMGYATTSTVNAYNGNLELGLSFGPAASSNFSQPIVLSNGSTGWQAAASYSQNQGNNVVPFWFSNGIACPAYTQSNITFANTTTFAIAQIPEWMGDYNTTTNGNCTMTMYINLQGAAANSNQQFINIIAGWLSVIRINPDGNQYAQLMPNLSTAIGLDTGQGNYELPPDFKEEKQYHIVIDEDDSWEEDYNNLDPQEQKVISLDQYVEMRRRTSERIRRKGILKGAIEPKDYSRRKSVPTIQIPESKEVIKAINEDDYLEFLEFKRLNLDLDTPDSGVLVKNEAKTQLGFTNTTVTKKSVTLP